MYIFKKAWPFELDKQLIDHALRSEQEGGPMNMCNALEEFSLSQEEASGYVKKY